MTDSQPLKGYSVLIVDGASLSVAGLSNRFSALGAKVHVMENAESALTLTRAKRLDVALISYQRDDDLKRTLEDQGVPSILCAFDLSLAA